jgi:hypothetical protein
MTGQYIGCNVPNLIIGCLKAEINNSLNDAIFGRYFYIQHAKCNLRGKNKWLVSDIYKNSDYGQSTFMEHLLSCVSCTSKWSIKQYF